MKDFFIKIGEKIGLFFNVSNTVNENAVMGVIVLAYIMITWPLLEMSDAQLYAWLAFDASFWGIGLGKSISANKMGA